jgi:hypothetical protein
MYRRTSVGSRPPGRSSSTSSRLRGTYSNTRYSLPLRRKASCDALGTRR